MIVREIEPNIKPLVDALNNLGILRTFSSCQGHYEESEQEFTDRNKADIRFHSHDNASDTDIEVFLNFLIVEFDNQHSFNPIYLHAYKLYTPNETGDKPDFVYVVEIEPFDRFDNADKKRKDTDNAILQTTKIVKSYISKKQ